MMMNELNTEDTIDHFVLSYYTPINKIENNIYVGSVHAFYYPSIFLDLDIQVIISLTNPSINIKNETMNDTLNRIINKDTIEWKKYYLSHSIFEDSDRNTSEEFILTIFTILKIIHKADYNNKKVFIHCKSGMHRSIAICCCYLILKYNSDWSTVFNKIKNIRQCSDPKYKDLIIKIIKTILFHYKYDFRIL